VHPNFGNTKKRGVGPKVTLYRRLQIMKGKDGAGTRQRESSQREGIRKKGFQLKNEGREYWRKVPSTVEFRNT